MSGSVPNLPDLCQRVGNLEKQDNPSLRRTWQQVWGRPAPKGARKRFLMLGIVWKWQLKGLGGYSPELARRLAALDARRDGGLSQSDFSDQDVKSASRPGPGARIVRDWKGERYEVHVTEAGYLWRGQSFGSLSAIAKAITGVSRNGPKFFGLRDGKGLG